MGRAGTHVEHDCRTVVLLGNQAKRGFTSAGNCCFDFQLSLFYGPLSPHQDPLPSSLLFFLFSFYVLAPISVSWCDAYCSNECRESRAWWQVLTLLSSLCCCPPARQTQLFCWQSVSLTLMVCLSLALWCASPTLIWVFLPAPLMNSVKFGLLSH